MAFLLDTMMVSNIVRRPHGPVASRMRAIGESEIFTSVVVAAEVRFGAAKQSHPQLSERIEHVLRELEVLPLEPPADAVYGMLRAGLERAGSLIGANDLWIAAHTLALGHTLVTDNVREFSRIDSLRIENWLH